MDETLTRLHRRAQHFSTAVDAVAPDRWDDPSPCAEWTVADVVHHVIDTQRDFLDRQHLDLGPRPGHDDPAAAWVTHRDALLSLIDEDVAATRCDGYFGPTTIGGTLAEFYGWDLMIHASDLLRAVGRPWQVGEQEVAELAEQARGWGRTLYVEGVCGPAVPVTETASAADRLLARLGRDPGWTPTS